MLARLRRDQAGANAVEFALVLPILLMLLLGTMYGASLFNTQQTITQAAREGARYAATLPLAEFGDGIQPPPSEAWFEDVVARVEGIIVVDRPLTRPGEPTVCVRFYDDEGISVEGEVSDGCPDASTGAGLTGPRVEVTVRRPARLELGVTSIGPITLSGSAIARYEPEIEE